jgi:hypothetical protein
MIRNNATGFRHALRMNRDNNQSHLGCTRFESWRGIATFLQSLQINIRSNDERKISRRKQRYFSSPTCADRLWGPPSLRFNGYLGLLARELGDRGVKLIGLFVMLPERNFIPFFRHQICPKSISDCKNWQPSTLLTGTTIDLQVVRKQEVVEILIMSYCRSMLFARSA